MINRSAAILRLFIAATSLLVGCSGRSERPTTVPVRGRLTYQGKPVAGATVAFLAPGAPRIAVGKTDDNGEFRLMTFTPDDGAIVGTHIVTVRKSSTQAATPAEGREASGDGAVDPATIEWAMKQSAEAMVKAKTVPSLPAKYADRKTSELRRDVVEGENYFEINLVD
jgi:hypothetical protein